MSNYLKIKPIDVSPDYGYNTANAIYWVVPYLGRGDTNAIIVCDLIYISYIPGTDINGNPTLDPVVSPSLQNFEMIANETLLNSWGPDSIIDDYVLTYDPRFERE